jgi:hypothetical protein
MPQQLHTLPVHLMHQRCLLPTLGDGCPCHVPPTLLHPAFEPQNTKTAVAAVTMNAGQHEDNNAGNSNVDAGNSGDDTDDGSVNAAGGENVRERRGQRVQQHHGSHNNNDDIEYGYCWTRRRTTYRNCSSSSLTPAQII